MTAVRAGMKKENEKNILFSDLYDVFAEESD